MRQLVWALCSFLLSTAPAMSQVVINEDRGGQIGAYVQRYTDMKSRGDWVRIDGNCLSACTLILGIVPRERICVTHRARLGFHAAWMPDEEGRPVTSPPGNQVLWNTYPPRIRAYIKRHGGLTRKMIYLEGRRLTKFLPSCKEAPLDINPVIPTEYPHADVRAQGN